MEISKITLNGKTYLIKDEDAQIVINQLLDRIKELEDKVADATESDSFNAGNIFVGLMSETDKDNPITYQYLTNLLQQDSTNNKVFENTDKPISLRYNWTYDGVLKTFFILVPAAHKNLYSLSSNCQSFSGWKDYDLVTIDFPSGSKPYKLFRFGNWLNGFHSEITYKF